MPPSSPRIEPIFATESGRPERRLWLLRVGVTFTLHRDERREDGKLERRWRVVTSKHEPDQAYRERIVRAA